MKTRLLGIFGVLALISACGPIRPPAPHNSFRATRVKPLTQTFTREELTDFQTDLMLFIGDVPELKPHFNVDGYDPLLRMRNHGDHGQVPHGIVNGTWMWAVNLPNYPDDLWPFAFAQAKKLGWTHWFLHVARADIGDGYHDLYPVDAEYAAGYGNRLNRAHAALLANGFIPVAAGVAPDAPPAPGFDTRQVLVAMTDWDSSNQADCRIDAIAQAFPEALLYYELPQGEYSPKPDACSQVKPDGTNGGAWLRSVQQRQPRFMGVVYETDDPGKGVQQAIDEIAKAHTFWRDVQEVGPESDTYWKFWRGISFDDQIHYNDGSCVVARGFEDTSAAQRRILHQPTRRVHLARFSHETSSISVLPSSIAGSTSRDGPSIRLKVFLLPLQTG